MNNKDYRFNLESLDRDLKNNTITREDAYDTEKKMTQAFKSGDNNRRLERLVKENPDKYRITGDR